MGKILGIDLGITSVGYGIIEEDTNAVIDYGVRLFDESSADNNTDRRSFRSQRRLKSRRHNRILAIKYFLKNHGFIDSTNFESLTNIYDLRIKGLTAKLTNLELANVLVNLAKRRGSSLDVVVEEGSEDASLASALSFNTSELVKRNLFVCELQKEYLEKNNKIRNSQNVFRTEDYEKELRQILSNQSMPQEDIEEIVSIIIRRRDFSEGPGSEAFPTPYGSFRKEKVEGKYVIKKVNLIEEMRGKCSVYPNEARAPKNSFTAYKFNLLNDLNNLILKEDNKITSEQKKEILEYIKVKGNITVSALLKILKMDKDEIKGFRINSKGQPLITSFDCYAKMIKDNINPNIIQDEYLFDQIVEILTGTLVIEKRQDELFKLGIGLKEEDIITLSKYTRINGYHSLSLKAMREINEEMIHSSDNQMQIISKNRMGKNEESLIGGIIPFDETVILSPVAKRVHRQALKLINQLRKEYGEFSKVVIETTREKNSQDEKTAIRNQEKSNAEEKEKTNKMFLDLGKNPDAYNTLTKLKLRLYNQQNGKTMYAGLPIDLDLLLNDPTAYQIEHIIPYSISFDNSLNNKALASQKENQDKGTLTPWGYFSSGKLSNINSKLATIHSWDEYVESVNDLKTLSHKKKEYLLSQKLYSKYNDMEQFIARNLIDTSYGIRTVMNTLKQYYKVNSIDTKVVTIKGRITHDFRQRAGLKKDRNEYIHHAIDALIIASLSNQKTFQSIYSISNENDSFILNSTGELIDFDNNPLEDSNLIQFIKNLKAIEGTPFDFSYKVDKKTNRAFSDQTIYSTRNIDGCDYVIKKYKDIYGQDGEALKKLFTEGKAKDKLLMARIDNKTFELFEKIYESYKNEKNPFLAYKEEHGPIRKFSKKNNGPIISQVKYIDSKLGNHLSISHKYDLNTSSKKVVLLQNSAYRTDVYKTDKGYQFITVRRYHVRQIDGKNVIDEEVYKRLLESKGIDEGEFLFSLNRNDIIDLVYPSDLLENISLETTHRFYRFIATNNDKANKIEVKFISQTTSKQEMRTIGKSVLKFDKYNVSITGKHKKVIKEDLKLEW